MEFHISRVWRERLNLDGLLFSYTGNVVFGDIAASRKLAIQLNDARGPEAAAANTVNAGALFAMGIIDELNHALVARYRKEIDPSVLAEAIRWFSAKLGPASMEQLLLAFTEQFPNVAVYRGELTAAEWLAGTTEGMSNREAAIEELMLLWLANINPAFAPFRDLFDDKDLQPQTIYKNVTSAIPAYLTTRPPVAPEIGSLFDALRAPALASPDSITGQLDFIRQHWSKYLDRDLRRLLLAIDVLREEDLAIWMRFHPPGPDRHRHGAPGRGGEGFIGDEFVGFDDFVGGVRRRRYAADYQAPLHEYEAFTADQAWMPNVVLIAKSTYVWLEQLSKKYRWHIHRLDHIPEEELALLANRGITGLWLIGLWERSVASRTIKRLRGHSDAVASAYSLKEYRIAEDLGGTAAYQVLRDRAAAVGIRLASDMVPNHMGIDSNWVIEHPDWFLFRWESPFPSYSFQGPDLSTDSRVEIKIEDHYYDQTDAAVAFRLRNYGDGTTRYVYHGNDGTTFAWNDTAQLDYSKSAVREHVIQTILQVARQFPIIRFDAAMVLAKRHVQRLWFPLPGAGGSIPSRAENALSQEEFDALMPNEFWREVVDRVAAEVPGTLLLAEAFWLLEGYFVRTLGMHRVYNSAFMNMLRDEENAKYRSYLKKTIEFDPDILKRYVNFMSNPDERTAIDQFGTGDKYFGVCTLLATLPGLPMFGHGQIEGFTERYGMEFKQARMEEFPNEGLVARHQHDIAPLLKNRRLFAESTNFVLYDFWTEHGTVDENVFAYSNRLGNERALVIYNNRYQSTRGTIHFSTAAKEKASGSLGQKSLTEGLALSVEDSTIFSYRDTAQGLEYLRRAMDLRDHGLSLDLRGYQYAVLLNWRELRPSEDQPWDRLCDALHGQGVYSVDEALSKLRLRPLHEALRQAISFDNIQLITKLAAEKDLQVENVGRKSADANTAAKKKTSRKQNNVAASTSQLSGFIEESTFCFERALESLSRKDKQAIETLATANVKKSSTARTKRAPAKPVSLESNFRNECEALTAAAVQLSHSKHNFSTGWPEALRYIVPGNKAGMPLQSWPPILAWIILRSFPVPAMRAELFDKLQLRSALAEIFSSFGMEGERQWRTAAYLRVLLLRADEPSVFTIESETFWNDPDVRWLADVHEASGITYFNKEQFEDLLSWIQLPALVEIAGKKSGGSRAIGEIKKAVVRACRVAENAGYKLDGFLDLMSSESYEPPSAGISKRREILSK